MDGPLKLKLPPGYYIELGADLMKLRRHDGSTVATFSAQGVAMNLVEKAAWEDYGDSPPSSGGDRAKRRRRDTFLAALSSFVSLVTVPNRV